MKLKIIGSTMLISFLLMIILSTVSMADTLEGEVHVKSIITLSFTPMHNMTFEDFSFPNGTLYQSGTKPDIFRNQLMVLDENVDEEDLFYETLNTQLSNIRRAQLFKVWRSLLHVQFSFIDVIYYPRWSFFFIGYTKPPYNPPSEIFNIKNIPWVNFGEGFYYVNYSDKSVALWTTYDPETMTMKKIGNKILYIVNATFPVQDSIYLEGNYYLKKYLEFCETCIKNLTSKSDEELSDNVVKLNDKISECIHRRTQYHTDFGYLCYNIDPLFFANNVNAYGIFKPMIDELTESATTAIEHNDYSLENLQQTKSIMQNELYERKLTAEVQRDYITAFGSVLVAVIFGGVITLCVNIWLQKRERKTSYAVHQRIEIYEPLYDEITKIIKDLSEYKCPFNAKETLKAWENLKPSDKNKIPKAIKDKILTLNSYGGAFYRLYINSLETLSRNIDSVMNRYRLEGVTRGELDAESLQIMNRFDQRKKQVHEEYRGDFLAGNLFDISGRPSLRRLLSMLHNRSVTEQYIFDRMVSSIENEQTIIDLRSAHERLTNFSKEVKVVLENKINTILNKYESKLKEI